MIWFWQGALPGQLENYLPYSSNLDGAWRLSIYTLALSLIEDEERDE